MIPINRHSPVTQVEKHNFSIYFRKVFQNTLQYCKKSLTLQKLFSLLFIATDATAKHFMAEIPVSLRKSRRASQA